jgi:deoxyribodipyrimidine photo-lyase
MIQTDRVKLLNTNGVRKGRFVLYWMQASQRAEWNHALEFAIERANEMGQPLVCLFGITNAYPEANLRHYAFILEGLRETQESLRNRGIQLVVRPQSPEEASVDLARDASLLVTDCGYTRVQRAWRDHTARHATCSVVQVETDVVVPIGVVSPKEEYAAATIRPKIHRHLDRFLVPLRERRLKKDPLGLRLGGLDLPTHSTR